MAQYIISIFRHYLPIIMSWGFHNAVAIKNGLRFTVQGYLHKGKIEVVYNEGSDLFTIRLLNHDGSIKKVEDDVYLDCLVDVIDSMVERCDNYADRVKHDYGLV